MDALEQRFVILLRVNDGLQTVKITLPQNEMIESPCVDVCRMSEARGVCIGCYRTLEEIARWRDMSEDEQTRLLTELQRRRRDMGPLNTKEDDISRR